jgi:choline dehydrogenase
VIQHLPGVGQNFQDHVAFGCVWESREAMPPRNNVIEAVVFWKSESGLDHPDLLGYLVEVPVLSE